MSITIDDTKVTGITIDGTPVQEVTIDGNVAWTAGPLDFYIYGGDDEGYVTKVNRNGVEQWSNQYLTAGFTHSLTAGTNGNYIYAAMEDSIYKISTTDGAEDWSPYYSDTVWDTEIGSNNNYLYGILGTGEVIKIDLSNGVVALSRNQHSVSGNAITLDSAGDIYSGSIWNGSSGGNIAKMSPGGYNYWTINYGSSFVNDLKTLNGNLYVAGGDGKIRSYNSDGSERSWGPLTFTHEIVAMNFSPDNFLYMLDNNSTVYKYEPTSENQVWEVSYTDYGTNYTITAGLNSNYIYHDISTSEIEMVNSDGTKGNFGYLMNGNLTATTVVA